MEPLQYPCWEFLECGGEVPQSRSGHTCALHKNRYLYIYGGFDGSNCFDDLYVLDLDAKQWRKIEAGGDRPSGRASHSAVTDELAGVMYIFGGSGSHFGYTNKRDLCEFSFETECWRLLSNPLEDTPSARYGQSMVAYQEGLYVWGGTHGTNYPTDMHKFDLCSKQWEYVETKGELPCGRYRHQAMVKDDLMYIVGGSGINRYGDVFTFHFGTNVWRKLYCTGTDLSDGRYAHTAVLHEGYMYLYGGNDGVRHDDLQELNLEKCNWRPMTVHGECPPGRDFHAAVLRRGSMVIFGGSNGMRRHNDVFEFHMVPKIPPWPCSLQSDFETLLEQAQTDEATQLSCDIFLAADNGDSAQGVFCHSHLLLVRCPRLYEIVQDTVRQQQQMQMSGADAREEDIIVMDGNLSSCSEEPGIVQPSQASEWQQQNSNLDSLLRAVRQRAEVRLPPHGWTAAYPHGRGSCAWVALDMQHEILWHFARFLYSETTRFGRLTAEHLYKLFLSSKHMELPRLAALCERQIKVLLGFDSVLPLLRASARDGVIAQPVQDACKHFFLANYNSCAELRECEALDPKLLCELMRLQNMRASSGPGSLSATSRSSSNAGGVSGIAAAAGGPIQQQPSVMAPLSPGGGVRGATNDGLVRDSYTLRDPMVGELVIPHGTLAEDLKRLLDESIAPDFEVVLQDEVIPVHKFVLVARSRYFASCILTSGMVESQAGRLVIPSNSAMTANAFRAFLRFIYAGDDILDVLAPHTAMYLVDASSFYGLTNQRLKHFCDYCVRDSINEAHVLQLFEASSRLGVEAVRAMALDFIIKHFHSVCRQPALEMLDKPLLIEIIKGLAEKLPPQPASAAGYSYEPRNPS